MLIRTNVKIVDGECDGVQTILPVLVRHLISKCWMDSFVIFSSIVVDSAKNVLTVRFIVLEDN